MKWIVLGLIIIAGFVAWRAWPRSHNLTVTVTTPTSGFSAKVYKTSGKSQSSVSGQQPVATVDKTQSLSLRQGTYLVVGGQGPDYQPSAATVDLQADQSVSVTPVYSQAKLASLLTQESPAITSAMKSSVSGLNSSYTTGTGQLFGLGDWYGTIIYPNLSAEQLRLQYVDVYRLVMKKDNGTWKLATDPPQLVLGAPNYPTIPKDVLDQVNKQQLP